MKKESFLKILENKNFLKLWGSQIISQVTANFLNFVLMIKIYEATGSATALSLFLLVYTAPSVFLGLFAGAIIDFWSKRKILLLSNLLQSLVVLFYLGLKGSIWPIYTIVFLYSLCDEFFGPSLGASLPALVEKENLAVANSLFLFTSQLSMLIGYSLGGPIIKFLGQRLPFIIASFFLLTAAVIAYFLPKDKPKKIKRMGLDKYSQMIIKGMGEGYRFIKSQPRVLYPFLFYVFFQMLIGVCIVLFPSLAREILSIDVKDAGLAVLLPVGLGALVGTFYVNRKIKTWGRKNLISVGWLLSGSCFLILALIIPRIVLAPFFAFLVLLFLGIGGVLVIITSLTMIQENTPEGIRGRVLGTLSTLMIISTYLPVFVLATITDFFGVITTLLLIGLTILLIGIISFKVERKNVLRTSYRT